MVRRLITLYCVVLHYISSVPAKHMSELCQYAQGTWVIISLFQILAKIVIYQRFYLLSIQNPKFPYCCAHFCQKSKFPREQTQLHTLQSLQTAVTGRAVIREIVPPVFLLHCSAQSCSCANYNCKLSLHITFTPPPP